MADGGTTDMSRLVGHSLQLRAIREADREVDFVCSTESIDGHGTKLMQSGWDFSRFDLNPVVLFCHDADELPVGQSIRHAVIDGQLIATVRFATEKANPLAENVWQSILQRTLRGISVRFLAKRYHFEKPSAEAEEVLVFDEMVLVELSVTPLPSNPETLAKLRTLLATETAASPARAPNTTSTERAALPREAETNMDKDQEIAALKSKVADTETAKRDLEFAVRESKKSAEDHEKRAAELSTKVEVLETQNKRLVEERDAASAARVEIEGKLIEREVDELIGRKISAAERDIYVKLRKSDRALFDEMVAQRKDMNLTTPAIPAEGNGAPPAPATPDAAAVTSAAEEQREWEELQKSARSHLPR
jgi:hypothetical protein